LPLFNANLSTEENTPVKSKPVEEILNETCNFGEVSGLTQEITFEIPKEL